MPRPFRKRSTWTHLAWDMTTGPSSILGVGRLWSWGTQLLWAPLVDGIGGETTAVSAWVSLLFVHSVTPDSSAFFWVRDPDCAPKGATGRLRTGGIKRLIKVLRFEGWGVFWMFLAGGTGPLMALSWG